MNRSRTATGLALLTSAMLSSGAPSPAAAGPSGNLWFLAVGVSRYQDAKMNLDFADYDAASLTTAAQRLQGATFGQVKAKQLVNQEANRGAVLAELRDLGANGSRDDVAIVAIAGHGVVQNGTYYFLPYGADRTNIATEGISLANLEDEVRSISSHVGKVVLLIDTCHAGAIELSVRGITSGSEPRTAEAQRSSGASGGATRGIGLAGELAPKVHEAYVLSASRETEESLEDAAYRLPGEPKGHGAFTYALLRGMRGEADTDHDNKVTVLELFRYTTTQVPKITGGKQHPWVDARGGDFDLVQVSTRSPESVKQASALVEDARLQEKAGSLDSAAKTYARAEEANPRDEVAQVLRESVNDDLLLRGDSQRRSSLAKQAQKLIEDSHQRGGHAEDPWAPRPMIVTFLGFQTLGNVKEGGGLHQALAQRVAQSLAGTKRVQVVERQLIDKILDEMKLSSSDLSDPTTRLQVGKILVARMIASGDVVFVKEPQFSANLRLIDTETSEIKLNLSKDGGDPEKILAMADEIAAGIVTELQQDYPIRGKIISVDGSEVVLNIGAKHGVTPGLRLKAITEEPVKVDGEIVAQRKKEIGSLEVAAVEEKASFARVVSKTGELAKGTKVIEASAPPPSTSN